MKKIFLTIILIAITLNSNPIDAKQLFNIEKVKVKKESFKESKEFYGITKLNESKTIDIVSRFDGYITHLNANKNYMNIKKGESLYTIYSSDIASIKAEIEIAKDLNKNLYDKANSKLENFDIKNAKFLNNEVVISSPISGIITQKNVNNLNQNVRNYEVIQKEIIPLKQKIQKNIENYNSYEKSNPQDSIKNLNELITYELKALDEVQKYYENYSKLLYYSNKGIK